MTLRMTCLLILTALGFARAAESSYDVIVAGGTSYGVAAAVSEARAGRKVLLVAPRPALGEDLAGTLRLRREDGAGLPADLAARLYAPNPAAKTSFGGVTPLQIKKVLDKVLLEAGVTFRCWLQPCDVAADAEGKVTGLWVAGRDGRRFIAAPEVIDATPFASLTRRAGVLPELPAGRYTFVRHVIAERRPTAEGLFVSALPGTERIAAADAHMSPQIAPAEGAPSEIDARIWRCAKTFDLPDFSARTLARIEQEMRDATWTIDQADGADFCYLADPPAGCGQVHRLTRDVRPAAVPPPVLAEVDVLVVGAGTAGAPAMIAAARQGAKTLCVEYSGRLGGITTDGVGRYCFGLQRGFTAELEGHLRKFGSFYSLCKSEWYRQEGRRHEVELWQGAQVVDAVVEGNRLTGAMVAMPDGTYGVVRAKVCIDATGAALLAARAGEPTEFLRADELSVQGAGSTPRLLGCSLINTDAFFIDDTDPEDISYEWLRARQSFGPYVWDQASVICSRERRRLIGAHYVTVQDAMAERNYPDLIGMAYSNFDTHGQIIDPEFLAGIPQRKKCLTVRLPYRALLPKKTDGLLVVGLGMSAHRDAMPVFRMQADLQNNGYVAGLAAAQAVRYGEEVRAIDITVLQRELVEKGILTEEELAAPEGLPLSDAELAESVARLGTDYRDLSRVLYDIPRALPLLRRAYAEEQDPTRKFVYAHVLGLLGDGRGAGELVAKLDSLELDAGWNYKGMGQFGDSLSKVDSYLFALGCSDNAGKAEVVEAILRKTRGFTKETEYSHYRAVAKTAEKIGDPRLAAELARLLSVPGVAGHALASDDVPPITGYDLESTHIGVADEERSDCLRELTLARALYRLGDVEGLAERLLKAYAADPRGVYAKHARSVLGQTVVWLECEDFLEKGDWTVETQFTHVMGSAYLLCPGTGIPRARPAITTVAIPHAGRWTVWARTKDWVPEHSPGAFELSVGGKRSPTLGVSKRTGWCWEPAGEYELAAGACEIRLIDRSGAYARCDALAFTDDPAWRPPESAAAREALAGIDPVVHAGGDYDVVVVGAGPGGMGASLAAARHGARVALVFDRPIPGGNASEECGIGFDGPSKYHSNARESGLVEELRLTARYYKISQTQAFLRLAAAESNLTLFADERVLAAETKDGRIVSVTARNTRTGRRTRYTGTLFVDATGDGWVAKDAGARLMHGREAGAEFGEEGIAPATRDELIMSGTLAGDLGRDTGHPVKYVAPSWAIPVPEGFDREVKRPKRPWWLENPGRINELEDPEFARDNLIRLTYGYWDWLKHDWKWKAWVETYELLPRTGFLGRREGYRVVGDTVVTAKDLQAGRIFPDRVAHGGWALDTHDPLGMDNPHGDGWYHPHGPVPIYSIPFSALYSADVSNLLLGSRCLSATHMALGSLRVQGTLMAVGQAVGTAAAMCAKESLTPRELGRTRIGAMQQQLLKDDQYIPELANADPADRARTARTTASGLTDGVSRPVGQTLHGWVSDGRLPASVELAFAAPQEIREIRLTFDSDLTPERIPEPMPKTLVRAYLVEVRTAGDWRQVAIERENHLRQRIHGFAPCAVEAVRITVLATWGDARGRIFEVRAY